MPVIQIAKDSDTIILTPFLLALAWLGLGLMAWPSYFIVHVSAFSILLLISIFFLFFFRDPEREIPPEGIVSPADGKVQFIEQKGNIVRVGVFMNINDVHVNRAPISGKVVDIRHIFGSYVPAFRKDSERNERTYITLETPIGTVEMVQIAGALVRRIVTYVNEGDFVRKGQRIGMIRFGSRVDVIMPSDRVKVIAEKGDKVKAGESVIALLETESDIEG